MTSILVAGTCHAADSTFKQRKADRLKRVTAHIEQLQAHKKCMDEATNPSELQKCKEAMRDVMSRRMGKGTDRQVGGSQMRGPMGSCYDWLEDEFGDTSLDRK